MLPSTALSAGALLGLQPHDLLRPLRLEPPAPVRLHRDLQVLTDRVDVRTLSPHPISLPHAAS
jgi:hypothetical protein